VDTASPADGGEGVARQVPTRRNGDVGCAHLPKVQSTLDAALLEMCGDGPAVNAVFLSEIGERTTGPVASHESVRFVVGQSSLDRVLSRV
jgi:hypothetical protein